ncbi:SMC-Scp complex subunit ScpB [Bacillus taeanensis]|uniref:Segregation and condensation protein B n=1 Tax=Bacillus taeanensis TaxID=273032 RepID=A0A366XXQ7_9BACI|nr:SMC-Scp complex subunit ScpB [Bacillus taeanensis]RBW70348.1 SMC-Scp complex subunit ScpB [Bacillus taeanensis]
MSDKEKKAIIEGLLFVVGEEGIELKQIAEVLEIDHNEAQQLLEQLSKEYQSEERGFELVEVAGVFQLTTKAAHADYYKKLIESPRSGTLSQAALETLAIIAYQQPITRAEVEEVRGVKTERPLQTLINKELIKEVGRAEGTGRAILYGTTKEFLEAFGLKSLQELPPLPEAGAQISFDEEADLFFEKFQQTLEEQ